MGLKLELVLSVTIGSMILLLLTVANSQLTIAKGVGLLHAQWPGGSDSPKLVKVPIQNQSLSKLELMQDDEIAPLRELPAPRLMENKSSDTQINNFEKLYASLVKKSPSPTLVFTPFSHNIVDAMIAVGNNYVITTTQYGIGFYDKSGVLLPEKNNIPNKMSATEFFSHFISPENADGTVNSNNINLHLGFPSDAVLPCNASVIPDRNNPNHDSCVSEFYDVRTTYDPLNKRFFILAAARNQMWIEGKPDNNPHTWADEDHKDLVRRYVAFAVSKTEDPRDGFHQWITTESNYADWPRIAVNQNYMVVAHNSPESNKPWTYVFYKSDLTNGKSNPANWRYYKSDFAGQPNKVYPVVQHEMPNLQLYLNKNLNTFGKAGPTPTFLTAPGNPGRVYAFYPSADPWTKAPLLSASINFNKFNSKPTGNEVPKDSGLGFAAGNPVYSNGKLYFSFSFRWDAPPELRSHIRFVRVPVEISTNSLALSTDTQKGYLDTIFGRNSLDDPKTALFSYHRPAVEVNNAGDVVVVYYRYRINDESTTGDEARYSVLHPGATSFLSSALLKPGECYLGPKDDDGSRMHHGGAFLDPSGDNIWVTHGYCNANSGGMHMAVGKVNP